MFRRRRINYLPIILVSLIVFIMFIFAMDIKMKSSILEIAQSKAQLRGMEKINHVINEEIVSNIEYEDIVYIHKDNDGKITMIQPNTIKLNQIMARTMIKVTHSLEEMTDDSFAIPMGQLTGSKILAGYGPKVKIKMIPASKVYVELLNKFEHAGINQTRHLIYFNIRSDITVAVPFLNQQVDVATTIPLAETIIVGDVPKTYVNFSGAENLLEPLIKGGN
ncbi:hypothetical protein SYNTR_1112 [Candidatus Syntrophocurvum alkaliphilum]|uniref:Sporulation protein YunB n=1 Tax=Candidatus Syntrophocurvum alkaliphilum TaxID=2293317 RepID=A0A6I6DAD6_9FIRM|nr:sporulation protein YunB [Candidatus Syntrophocurvum alkaliphilum]QGT99705.1 hypothetical protein SYNTR_1112 [Candidatus Syntrophocurvum alkaliphilum]